MDALMGIRLYFP